MIRVLYVPYRKKNVRVKKKNTRSFPLKKKKEKTY